MCGGGGMHTGRHKQQSAGQELPSPPPPRRHAATWRGSGAWRAARHAPPLPAGTAAAHARCSRRVWARCRPRRARSQSRAASTRRHTQRRPSPRSVLLSPRRVARRPCSSCRQATSRWRRIARLERSVPGRLPPPPRPHPRRPPRAAARRDCQHQQRRKERRAAARDIQTDPVDRPPELAHADAGPSCDAQVFGSGRIPMSVIFTWAVNFSGYQVTASFPNELVTPKSASAIAVPPDCPG